jgi:Ca2+-binding RTX toxin-like protein
VAVIVANQDGATVAGTAGDDSISGTANFASIDAGAGADTIGRLGGRDTLHGGAGNDSITASTAGLAYGDDGADTIVGLPDETVNFIEGGAGDDVLDGDPVEQQPFISYAMYTTATSGVRVSLATEAAQAVGGGQGVDVVRNFNGLIGSAFADTLTAGEAFQHLFGGAGDDRLEAGNGGGVELTGGAGDDLLVGGAGDDFAVYLADPAFGLGAPTGGLTIDLRVTAAQDVGGGMGRDTFVSIEGVVAGAFADTITGSDAANLISGREGSDLIMGLGGADLLAGDAGDDTILAGDGDDRINDFGGRNVLRGEAGADTVAGAGDPDDLHGNMGADSVTGGAGADTVRGGQGDDVIAGGDGADFLAGDRGSDTVTGGAGADIFHAWDQAGLDRVADFSAAQGDRVFLLPGATPTISQVGADTVIDFGGDNRIFGA